MTVENRKNIIYSRITAAFSPTYLEVIDESDKHVGHAGHQGGGRHFAIVIASDVLSQLSRVEAHKRIYALLNDMMPDQIHALKIKIL